MFKSHCSEAAANAQQRTHAPESKVLGSYSTDLLKGVNTNQIPRSSLRRAALEAAVFNYILQEPRRCHKLFSRASKRESASWQRTLQEASPTRGSCFASAAPSPSILARRCSCFRKRTSKGGRATRIPRCIGHVTLKPGW